ncbi:MAG TPA: hypothetical protein VHF69_04910, partial [Candidatus Synoicihabitans sp.]|nr:hypothetical protein [Candidatus Synoicihabitans sp.]
RTFVVAVLGYADESRRLGRLDEARAVYEALGELPDPETERRRRLLIAYTLLGSGEWVLAREHWQQCEQPVADASMLGLFWLIAGALAAHEQRHDEAFDALSRGMVDAEGVDEWRPELLTLLAQSYDAVGRTSAAEAIRNELMQFYGRAAPLTRIAVPAHPPTAESPPH